MKTVPQLTKKKRRLADLDPESLAFALNYREILAAVGADNDEQRPVTRQQKAESGNGDQLAESGKR